MKTYFLKRRARWHEQQILELTSSLGIIRAAIVDHRYKVILIDRKLGAIGASLPPYTPKRPRRWLTWLIPAVIAITALLILGALDDSLEVQQIEADRTVELVNRAKMDALEAKGVYWTNYKGIK